MDKIVFESPGGWLNVKQTEKGIFFAERKGGSLIWILK